MEFFDKEASDEKVGELGKELGRTVIAVCKHIDGLPLDSEAKQYTAALACACIVLAFQVPAGMIAMWLSIVQESVTSGGSLDDILAKLSAQAGPPKGEVGH